MTGEGKGGSDRNAELLVVGSKMALKDFDVMSIEERMVMTSLRQQD